MIKLELRRDEFMFLFYHVLLSKDNIEIEERTMNTKCNPYYKALLTRLKNKMEEAESESKI